MDNYFDLINNDVLTYIIKKLLTQGRASAIVNLADFSKSIEKILNNDIIYLQSLKDHPEMQFTYKKYLNVRHNDWIDKYLFYKTLERLIPFVEHVIYLLKEKLTEEHVGLYVDSTKNMEDNSANGSLDYLDVPGLSYPDIRKRILKYIESPFIENMVYELRINEHIEGPFSVSLNFYSDYQKDKDLTLDNYLSESQVKILIAGILYSNISLVDGRGGNIFREW